MIRFGAGFEPFDLMYVEAREKTSEKTSEKIRSKINMKKKLNFVEYKIQNIENPFD